MTIDVTMVGIQGPPGAPATPVRVATAGTLPAYTSDPLGLTGNAIGQLTVDSVALQVNDKLLVKDEVLGSVNRVCVVQSDGVAAPYRLVFWLNQVYQAGILVTVGPAGTENALTAWQLATDDPIVLGTTALAWAETLAGNVAVTDDPLVGSGTIIDPLGLNISDGLVVSGGALKVDAGYGIIVDTGGVALDPTALSTQILTGRHGTAFGVPITGTITFGSNNHVLIDTTGLSSVPIVQLPAVSTVGNGAVYRVSSYARSQKFHGGVRIQRAGSDTIEGGITETVITAGRVLLLSAHAASGTWIRQNNPYGVLTPFDFGALGIGSAHDDWDAVEAAFDYIRKNNTLGLANGSLYFPQPPTEYYFTKPLRPGCSIYMHGDGSGYNTFGGSVLRFQSGCPGLNLESPYNLPAGYSRSNYSRIANLTFASGPYNGQDSNAARWQANHAYTVGSWIRSTVVMYTNLANQLDFTKNLYVFRCEVAGTSGGAEPVWPNNHLQVSPPVSQTTVTDGTVTWRPYLAHGICVRDVGIQIENVSIDHFVGSGLLITSGFANDDASGVADDCTFTNVSISSSDRFGVQVGFGGPPERSPNSDVNTFTNVLVHSGGTSGFWDRADLGNIYNCPHAEVWGQPFNIVPTYTAGFVNGFYGESQGSATKNHWGTKLHVTSTGQIDTEPDSTSTAVFWSQNDPHVMLGWLKVQKNLTPSGYLQCQLGEVADYGAGDNGVNVSFRLTSNYDAVTSSTSWLWNTGKRSFQWCGSQSFPLGVQMETAHNGAAHGLSYMTFPVGFYTGWTTAATPSYYWRGPRDDSRYVALDTSGYVDVTKDVGVRALGARMDTPAATLHCGFRQVIRAGQGTMPWKASSSYTISGFHSTRIFVRPTDLDTTQAWELDTTFSSSGVTGATEPSWPASPNVNDTVDDPNGQLRWKYVGVCARFQDFADVSGWCNIAFGGSGDMTLTETSESYLGESLKLTGTLTGNRNLILPVIRGAKRWVYNATTGAFTVTIKTASGTGVLVTQGQAREIVCDGVNILARTANQDPTT